MPSEESPTNTDVREVHGLLLEIFETKGKEEVGIFPKLFIKFEMFLDVYVF